MPSTATARFEFYYQTSGSGRIYLDSLCQGGACRDSEITSGVNAWYDANTPALSLRYAYFDQSYIRMPGLDGSSNPISDALTFWYYSHAITFWVYFDSGTNVLSASNRVTLLDTSDGSGNGGVKVNVYDSKIEVIVAGATCYASSMTAFSQGEWRFVGIVMSSTSTVDLYLDSGSSSTPYSLSCDGSFGAISTYTLGLTIGADNSGTPSLGVNNYFSMADLMFFNNPANYALTSSQINELISLGVTLPVAYGTCQAGCQSQPLEWFYCLGGEYNSYVYNPGAYGASTDPWIWNDVEAGTTVDFRNKSLELHGGSGSGMSIPWNFYGNMRFERDLQYDTTPPSSNVIGNCIYYDSSTELGIQFTIWSLSWPTTQDITVASISFTASNCPSTSFSEYRLTNIISFTIYDTNYDDYSYHFVPEATWSYNAATYLYKLTITARYNPTPIPGPLNPGTTPSATTPEPFAPFEPAAPTPFINPTQGGSCGVSPFPLQTSEWICSGIYWTYKGSVPNTIKSPLTLYSGTNVNLENKGFDLQGNWDVEGGTIKVVFGRFGNNNNAPVPAVINSNSNCFNFYSGTIEVEIQSGVNSLRTDEIFFTVNGPSGCATYGPQLRWVQQDVFSKCTLQFQGPSGGGPQSSWSIRLQGGCEYDPNALNTSPDSRNNNGGLLGVAVGVPVFLIIIIIIVIIIVVVVRKRKAAAKKKEEGDKTDHVKPETVTQTPTAKKTATNQPKNTAVAGYANVDAGLDQAPPTINEKGSGAGGQYTTIITAGSADVKEEKGGKKGGKKSPKGKKGGKGDKNDGKGKKAGKGGKGQKKSDKLEDIEISSEDEKRAVTLVDTPLSDKQLLDGIKTDWLIPHNDLTFEKKLGQGAFGVVYRGRWNQTLCAIKQTTSIQVDTAAIEAFKAEAQLLMNLRPHPNVVQVLGICLHESNFYMVMEFCEKGSLDRLFGKDKLTLRHKLKIIQGISLGCQHLHANNIVHRDLAARNVLLARGFIPKISDFGMSRIVDKFERKGVTSSNVGPIKWMAPESLKTKEYGPETDVYTFAIVCYEIMDEKEPFADMDMLEAAVKVRDGTLKPTLPDGTPKWLFDLCHRCWSLDPKQRPTFKEISTEITSQLETDESEESDE